MNWPKVDLVAEFSDEGSSEKTNKAELAFNIIAGCIESIFDSKRVYPAKDQTKEELHEFLESLNQNQFKKIQEFIEAMPKLEHNVEFECVHCKTKNSILVRGIQSFFSSPSPTTV